MTAIRFRVRGRVQGVGFRWFVRKAARDAELSGWVRNLPDGDVEVLAAGTAEGLDRLREALRRGPPAARVVLVEERTEPDGAASPSGPFEIV
jgi:acylphosphatase